jgi:2-hydroxychromene-2-carboxylate isomerase
MAPTLEFWFEFASTYSYVAAMRIETMCTHAGVALSWRPFLLGPIFQLQGWGDSPFNLNPLRGAYMWRDLERLTRKFGLPWKRPSVFPRNTVAAARIAAAFSDEPWIGEYIRRAFIANFAEDRELNDPGVVRGLLKELGQDGDAIWESATTTDRREALRRNTERAIAIGIFGAPNCVVSGEVFWGEETLEDAIDWALTR